MSNGSRHFVPLLHYEMYPLSCRQTLLLGPASEAEEEKPSRDTVHRTICSLQHSSGWLQLLRIIYDTSSC